MIMYKIDQLLRQVVKIDRIDQDLMNPKLTKIVKL